MLLEFLDFFNEVYVLCIVVVVVFDVRKCVVDYYNKVSFSIE